VSDDPTPPSPTKLAEQIRKQGIAILTLMHCHHVLSTRRNAVESFTDGIRLSVGLLLAEGSRSALKLTSMMLFDLLTQVCVNIYRVEKLCEHQQRQNSNRIRERNWVCFQVLVRLVISFVFVQEPSKLPLVFPPPVLPDKRKKEKEFRVPTEDSLVALLRSHFHSDSSRTLRRSFESEETRVLASTLLDYFRDDRGDPSRNSSLRSQTSTSRASPPAISGSMTKNATNTSHTHHHHDLKASASPSYTTASSATTSLYGPMWKGQLGAHVRMLNLLGKVLLDPKFRPSGPLAQRIFSKQEIANLQALSLFVTDSSAYLRMIDDHLWAILTPRQLLRYNTQFVAEADPRRRRKIFYYAQREKDRSAELQDRKLDRAIKADHQRAKAQKEILLIGPEQSGKSTFLKQLMHVHADAFPPEVRLEYKEVIYGTIIVSVQNLVFHAERILSNTNAHMAIIASAILGSSSPVIVDDSSNARAVVDLLRDYCGFFWLDADLRAQMALIKFAPSRQMEVSNGLRRAIKAVWSDASIRKLFRERRSFQDHQLDDSCAYFLSRLDMIMPPIEQKSRGGDPMISDPYVPTMEDVLNTRERTLGVVEKRFTFNHKVLRKSDVYRVIDVGGQRGLRRKWIPFFQTCDYVFFVLSLTGYNRCLREQPNIRQMDEALDFLKNLFSQPLLQMTPVVVFLNKWDLFKKELAVAPLSSYFKNYRIPSDLIDSEDEHEEHQRGEKYWKKLAKDATRYIIQKELKPLEVETHHSAPVYYHVTCATDTSIMKRVFRRIFEHNLRMNIEQAALI